jgi:hypothetical protein
MIAKANGAIMRSALFRLILLLIAIVVSIQLLYTAGQVYHAAMVAYKGGGPVLHMISFGEIGVFVYFGASICVIGALWEIIRLHGGIRGAKVATFLLIFSLLNTAAFICLVVMPYSDVVSRF